MLASWAPWMDAVGAGCVGLIVTWLAARLAREEN